MKKNKDNNFIKIIKKLKPSSYKQIINYKGNLLDDNILDSFDIVKLCVEIESVYKIKINQKNINRKSFSSFEDIKKLIK